MRESNLRSEATLAPARELFETFHDRPPEREFEVGFLWPKEQILLGMANRIGYRSNKWMEPNARGQRPTQDYIHQHDEPRPRILIERPSPCDGDRESRVLCRQSLVSRPVKMPDPPVFTVLGWALDLEFIRDGRIGHIDWKQNGQLPLLASNRAGTLLLIFYEKLGKPPLLIHGPKMRVTAHGLIS